MWLLSFRLSYWSCMPGCFLLAETLFFICREASFSEVDFFFSSLIQSQCTYTPHLCAVSLIQSWPSKTGTVTKDPFMWSQSLEEQEHLRQSPWGNSLRPINSLKEHHKSRMLILYDAALPFWGPVCVESWYFKGASVE